MYQIKLMNKIAETGLSRLPADKFTCSEDVANPDGILVRSADLNNSEFNPELLAIARAGAGVNNIPLDRAAEEGIVVFNTPGANANAVKELVICALFLSSRRIPESIEWAKTLKGRGDEVGKLAEKGKSSFVGPEILGKTLGVIGLGAIGVMVANAAQHLGMKVLGYDPYLSVDAAWNLSHNIRHCTELDEIFKECDYITLHVPANAETTGMISRDSIALMKPDVRILNFARNALVSTDDMLEALAEGKVARYITDFAEEKLLDVENVIVLPHLGASTPESEDNCAVMAARELREYILNGTIRNSVNFPNVELQKTNACRICVLHKNVPNVVNSLTSLISEHKLNIEHMQNASKRDYAYTVVDIEADVDDSLVGAISALDNIIRVRVIK